VKTVSLSLAAVLLLSACHKSESPAENAAAQLENAADQSDPAAAAVLDNEADALRANGTTPGNAADPNGAVQSAMENAGSAAGDGNTQ